MLAIIKHSHEAKDEHRRCAKPTERLTGAEGGMGLHLLASRRQETATVYSCLEAVML